MNLCYIDWHVTPFRADRWYEIWEPAAERAMAFGAKGWSISRSIEDPLLFRQSSLWEDTADFETYWNSDEVVGDPRGGASLLREAGPPRLAQARRRRVSGREYLPGDAVLSVPMRRARRHCAAACAIGAGACSRSPPPPRPRSRAWSSIAS